MGKDDVLYRATFEHAAVPLLVLERETGAVVAVNACFARWLGFEPEALCGRTLEELEIGTIQPGEVRLRTASGGVVAAACKTEQLGARVLVTLLEIPSEQRLQQVIDTLHEGIIIIDEHGSVLYFNPAAREAYGFAGDDEGWLRALYDRDTFETRTLDGALVDPEDRPSAKLLRGEIVRGVELWVTRSATGARRALRYSGSRLRQPDGSHVVVLAFSDISGRVESTHALRELNDTLEQRVDERTSQLEAANRELEAFTYSVSHDLRAPVRAITSFSQIIVDDFGEILPDEARRLLGRVQAGGVRLGELVDDLLSFSQLGRHSLRLRDVDVDQLVRTVADRLVQETGFADKVALEITALGRCAADASLLEQVWTNLIENALKYSSTRARISIEISRRDSDVDAVFSIRDNGVGFDMRHADKLFGVFQRLHSNEEFEGTGVGLANVRRIVERHGGTIVARSTLDAGSTFEFSIPLRPGSPSFARS